MPDRLAVPFPLSVNVSPAGSAPVSVSAGTGMPVVVTVKPSGARIPIEVESALVIVGACPGLITDTSSSPELAT